MEEHTQVRALAARVLVVAVYKPDIGDWAAYIDAVPGMSHSREYQAVANNGEKLPQKVAELLFPDLASKYRWRD